MTPQQQPPRIRPYEYPTDAWIARYQAGATITRIAADYGVSAGTVTRNLSQAGVALRGRKARWLA